MMPNLRGLAKAATVAVAAGGVALALPGSVSTAAAGSFEGGSASARAEGVRVQIDSVGAPGTDRPLDFGFPSSSASVSGLQGSSAQASLAYPGEIVLNGPGLCQVVFPQCKLPDYPFIVESSYGTKNEARATYGLTALEAVSQPSMSKGSAVSAQGDPNTAGGQNASISTGTIDPDTGVAKAEAATVTDAISFGDTLKIASVRSTASVTQEPGKELVRSASLEVKGVTIAGQAVGITSQGLIVGDNPTPLPAGNPFEEELAQGGIKLRWLGGYNTTDGIVAPALEIVAQGQMPGLPAPSVLTIRLGYATAGVQAGRASAGSFDLSVPATSPTTEVTVPADTPPASTAGDTDQVPDTVVGGSNITLPEFSIGGQPLEFAAPPAPPAEANAAIGSSEVAAASPAAPTEARLRSGSSRELATRRAAVVVGSAPSDGGRTLYLLLAAGALLALLAVSLFRLLAMRLGGQS
jgi:hypothetical protein